MNAKSSKNGLFFSALVVALLSCCATLMLTSCSKKASTVIIGKWQAQETKEIVEFRKDGTLIDPQNEKHNGTYTFTDGSHMNLQINTGETNQPEMSASCEVQIHGNTMDMIMTVTGQGQQQNVKAHFTRLK